MIKISDVLFSYFTQIYVILDSCNKKSFISVDTYFVILTIYMKIAMDKYNFLFVFKNIEKKKKNEYEKKTYFR